MNQTRLNDSDQFSAAIVGHGTCRHDQRDKVVCHLLRAIFRIPKISPRAFGAQGAESMNGGPGQREPRTQGASIRARHVSGHGLRKRRPGSLRRTL